MIQQMERTSTNRYTVPTQPMQAHETAMAQRKHTRYAYAFFVSIAPVPRDDSPVQFMQHEMARVDNISGGGIRLTSQLSVRVGAPVELRVSLEGRTLELAGKVLEREPTRDGFGYRIAFTQLSHQQQDMLDSWIAVTVKDRQHRTS